MGRKLEREREDRRLEKPYYYLKRMRRGREEKQRREEKN